MDPIKGWPQALFDTTPWDTSANNKTGGIWLSSSLILTRNLYRHQFPHKLTENQAIACRNFIQMLFTKTALENVSFMHAETLTPIQREYLHERMLYRDSLQNVSPGQACGFDPSSQVFSLINCKNHITLQCDENDNELFPAWQRLNSIDNALTATTEIAFSSRFGYLTADPAECGTALIALLYLHIPALNHTGQLALTIQSQIEEEINPISLEGAFDDLLGDILILKNRYTLGVSEETILHSLQTAAWKIAAAEKALRSLLKEQSNIAIQDHIGRAFGLLTHSYQLQTKETINALSLIKLGIDLGYIQGSSQDTINRLIFQSRRAHILNTYSELKTEELPRKRAEIIQKCFHMTSLQ